MALKKPSLLFVVLVLGIIILALINLSDVPYEYPGIYLNRVAFLRYDKPYPLFNIDDQMNIGIDGSVELNRIIRYDPPTVVIESNLTDFFQNETEIAIVKIPTNIKYILREVTINGELIDDFNIKNEINKEDSFYYGDGLSEDAIKSKYAKEYFLRTIKIDPNKQNTIKLKLYLSSPTEIAKPLKSFPFSQSITAIYISPTYIHLSKEAVNEIYSNLEENVSQKGNLYGKIFAQLFYQETNISELSPWIDYNVESHSLHGGIYYQASINLPKEQTLRTDVDSIIYIDWDSEYSPISGYIGDIFRNSTNSEERKSANEIFNKWNIINTTLISKDSNNFIVQSPLIIGSYPKFHNVIIWLWVKESFKLKLLFIFLLIFGLFVPLSATYFGEASLKKLIEGWLVYIGIWSTFLLFFYESIPNTLNFYFLLPIISLFASIAIAPAEILNSIPFTAKISSNAIKINAIRIFSLLLVGIIFIYCQM